MKKHSKAPDEKERKLVVPRWLRIVLPAAVILVWFGLAGFGGPTFGKLSSVSTNDQVSFLPESAESTQVQQQLGKFQDSDAVPAIVVFESEQDIQPAELAQYADISRQLGEVGAVDGAQIAGPIPSEDRKAVQFIVPVDSSAEVRDVVGELREVVDRETPEGTVGYVAGPAGLSADLTKAFGGIDGLLLVVALSVVFVILLVVYRSIALPFIVLINALFALCAAILLVYGMAKWGWITLNGQSQGILFILVIGAATDYSLLLVARYREALERVEDTWLAMRTAIKNSFEPIAASSATVILALLCLLLSDLNSNRSLGPIAATGIVFSFLGTMIFLPAMLVALGRSSFWPRRPKVESKPVDADITPLWRKVGQLIQRHSLATWSVSAVLLVLACGGLLQLKADGVPQTDLLLTESQAVDGQEVIERHYDASTATPMYVIADESKKDAVVEVLEELDGVESASVSTGAASRPGAPAGPPKVVNGTVLIAAILTTGEPDSEASEEVVVAARDAVKDVDDTAIVGGTTAVALDTNETAQRDLMVIIPTVLAMIFIVLVVLLRSILAPLLLIATVVLSYGATLGVSALVFNEAFGFAGADAAVPLFGFVFLVALGIDYNIFLMTRVREEAAHMGTKKGIIYGLGKTGGVITSAGVVLAATFAALGVIPILFLAQIAFIVAFGVLLDTIIVRSLLVPALSYDIGKRIWWPSKLWREGKE